MQHSARQPAATHLRSQIPTTAPAVSPRTAAANKRRAAAPAPSRIPASPRAAAARRRLAKWDTHSHLRSHSAGAPPARPWVASRTASDGTFDGPSARRAQAAVRRALSGKHVEAMQRERAQARGLAAAARALSNSWQRTNQGDLGSFDDDDDDDDHDEFFRRVNRPETPTPRRASGGGSPPRGLGYDERPMSRGQEQGRMAQAALSPPRPVSRGQEHGRLSGKDLGDTDNWDALPADASTMTAVRESMEAMAAQLDWLTQLVVKIDMRLTLKEEELGVFTSEDLASPSPHPAQPAWMRQPGAGFVSDG
jgi:hypothetical protein